MLDILIRNAKVVDGSGGPGYAADIAIAEGRIAEIGRLEGATAGEVIDAQGLVAAPGLIDMHSHSDSTLPINPLAESKVRQGVTTEVIGMCGSSTAPISEAQRAEHLRSAGSAGAILGWAWSSFGEYLDRLRAKGLAVNVVPLAGQGTIRNKVMGHTAAAPTPDQVAAMQAEVAQAMDEGAWGISTGLIYPPGSYATTAEIVDLAKVAAPRGGFYFSHIRGEGPTLLAALAEAITIGQEAGLPVQVAHYKAYGKSNWPKSAVGLEMLDEARRRGIDITPDMYPYVASSTGLAALLPGWAHEGGAQALLARLADPATRAKIRQEVLDDMDPAEGEAEWEGTVISRCVKAPAYEGKHIAQLATEKSLAPVDAVLAIVAETEADASMIRFKMSEENLRAQLRYGQMMIGSDGYSLASYGPLGEGKPHPRNYGTFPRVLARYVREQGVLSLEEAIHRMSGLPAAKLGLAQRGLLRPGCWADVVLLDPATVQDRATFAEPHQYPAGIPYVLVNGRVVIAGGHHRGVLPGQVLQAP